MCSKIVCVGQVCFTDTENLYAYLYKLFFFSLVACSIVKGSV